MASGVMLPGQYEDEITGLNYNWHRDYDPSLGRYIQSDPLGLYDGPNTYGYVHQNPINKFDPTGEAVFLAAPAVPAAIEVLGASASLATAWWVGTNNNQLQSQSCPGTPSGDPDCDKLNKDVQDAKKEIKNKFTGVGAACRPGMSKWQLNDRKASWLRLARARTISIQRCWNGGDENHQSETGSAWSHVQNCDALIGAL
ncbi:RHS repeat-associated core domain-containing protein [Marinibactrum halimedae]|uniref:RHS repeat-associated core domain-containing protein n=1 Tax=Marinibactrum halimedae TaxID=1444977 RepID=A0AA37WN64_9GAMM|nr:RHS repeat-associated core domain-containing protein [Marinibactrum halimedae]MCD9461244.1 RHS repeat-associated core domain-containing protein [Marinibactrum halimedae]GLS27228.1 hypothetical protein GCM10007877_29470 [Marinibactrum halimedae]